jgi:hypothetical protein
MGRETVLAPVSWPADSWPVASQIRGTMSGWALPAATKDLKGSGPFVADNDTIDFSSRGDGSLPAHFTYWRYPGSGSSFSINSLPFGRSGTTQRPVSGTLRIEPSTLNLTALNGNYAGPQGQAFIGRRQTHTEFSFRVDLDFTPTALEEEAGVSAFLTQNHHLDMGVVVLPLSRATGAFPPIPAVNASATPSSPFGFPIPAAPTESAVPDPDPLTPMVRLRGISYVSTPAPLILPIPTSWRRQRLTLSIRAPNATHYVFSLGTADTPTEQLVDLLTVDNAPVSWGFTGVLLGVYATTNGEEGGDGGSAEVSWWSRWRYEGLGQRRE